MENEKKHNKVLEIILIILVSLSFVLIPLLNQYRQKIISQNNSELFKREVNGNGSDSLGENGNIYLDQTGDVYTFYNNDVKLNLNKNVFPSLISGNSITGTNDVFGYNCKNYFCFVYNPVYHNALASDFDKIYNFVYYIELDNFKSITITLGYYEIYTTDTDTFYHLTPIKDSDFNRFGIIPTYSVLNLSYYDDGKVQILFDFITENGFNVLIGDEGYQIHHSIFNSYSLNRIRFVNIDKDFVTPLLDNAKDESYQDGYKEGYNDGYDEGSSKEGVFSMLKHAAMSIQDLLNIEVLPNISLWLLISIPLSVSIILVMFKLLRGDN